MSLVTFVPPEGLEAFEEANPHLRVDRKLYVRDFIYREYVDEAVKQHNLWQDAEGRFQQEKARRQQAEARLMNEEVLKQQQKAMIQLMASDGLSIPAIAKYLNLSEQAVRQYLSGT